MGLRLSGFTFILTIAILIIVIPFLLAGLFVVAIVLTIVGIMLGVINRLLNIGKKKKKSNVIDVKYKVK